MKKVFKVVVLFVFFVVFTSKIEVKESQFLCELCQKHKMDIRNIRYDVSWLSFLRKASKARSKMFVKNGVEKQGCFHAIKNMDDKVDSFFDKLKDGLKDLLLDYSWQSKKVDLFDFESRTFSQNGEDGVIEAIFEFVGVINKYYVEFGVESGVECNTRLLREKLGWNGLLMDGNSENSVINLRKEFITAENINDLFRKHNVPAEFDLLSIDIDYNDFHVWNAISDYYQPRVVAIEHNASHLPSEDKVVVYGSSMMWDKTNYFGASIKAMYNLGRSKGYSLVYAEQRGVNLFFIRDDILENIDIEFSNVNDVEALYQTPKYGNNGHPKDPKNRKYLSSKQLLKI